MKQRNLLHKKVSRKKNVQIFFKMNESQDILRFGDFVISKIVLYNKIVPKTLTKKIKKSIHCFLDNYLKNHLGGLRKSPDYQFF